MLPAHPAADLADKFRRLVRSGIELFSDRDFCDSWSLLREEVIWMGPINTTLRFPLHLLPSVEASQV